ncbi:MAG: family 78 glycoside hydrolase catalytic domain [Saprospiraceae bacterium]|nr:family 78 glycoside hydrolase catalytic domain [Saprospiraceae bacterium]
MKNYSVCAFFIFNLLTASYLGIAQDQVINAICEYKSNPIGIDIQMPRLSWQIRSTGENIKQSAYEIRVSESQAGLENKKDLLWTSGKVVSDQSLHVAYQGPPLVSMQRVYWQVRIWNNNNQVSDWSEVAFWEMGILEEEIWKASWITKQEDVQGKNSLPAQYYRKEFAISKKIYKARVYVTSLGLYQLFINGKKVGNDLFTPGYTSYHKRLQYQTYDVSTMLQQNNAIGAIVGDGWYRGFLGWKGERSYYGDHLALLVQLRVDYSDGTSETITTNKEWKVSYGPILQSDIYHGETYDARLEMESWAVHGYNDMQWNAVDVLDYSKEILVAPVGMPVKAIEELSPIKMITTPKGETVVDLGQNMVGWVRMKVKGEKGDKVTLQFAEVLDKEGNFYTTNLRAAKATDVYILQGGEEEVYEPRFTFHGFRFVKIEGFPGELTPGSITGVVIHSDMKPTGTFICSDTLINQLQKNIQWGQKGNFLDVPTDCPQRDERVGWTGDAQIFSSTAAFNFDVAAFYTKWLKDLAADQQPNGSVPHVIPDMLNGWGGATGWADAAVIVPWTVYQAYGDQRILAEQYLSMKAWIDFMQNKAGEDFLWNNAEDWHWGDWLAFHSDKPDYAGSVTEKDLIATAYFYHSTRMLSKIASIIGQSADATRYQQLAEHIKTAFIKEFITPNGRLVSHTQTAYALAISFDLIPDTMAENSARYFAEDVERFGHLTTGFLGTPLLCSTLSKIERDDLAFMLLNRKEFPSWLYPVTQGATTIWERWDTQKPDGTIIQGMNSFNHYAYGAIGEWLYTHVAGLSTDPEQPGYRHIIFNPHPGGGLTTARAEFVSLFGPVKSSWEIRGETFIYSIEIPVNTSGTVILPDARVAEIRMNSEELGPVYLNRVQQENNQVVITLGSGKYLFEYSLNDFNEK